jgi:hypothetical protein
MLGGIGSKITNMFGMGPAAQGREAEDDSLGLTDAQEDRLKAMEDQ